MATITTAISAEGRVRSMSDLLKRIANYFANEYDGDDKTAPKMELSVDELRYIASMHVDRCRAEAELRELKNKRYSRTNADHIRSFSDEELAEFIEQISTDSMETISFGTKEYEEIWEHKETALQWLQSEVEE